MAITPNTLNAVREDEKMRNPQYRYHACNNQMASMPVKPVKLACPAKGCYKVNGHAPVKHGTQTATMVNRAMRRSRLNPNRSYRGVSAMTRALTRVGV